MNKIEYLIELSKTTIVQLLNNIVLLCINMIRVGLNGFGRIGRAITRIISNSNDINLVAVNDIDDDTENLTYLLKYDTTYGKFTKSLELKNKNSLLINNNKIHFYSET